jgi:hypothetical protein
VSRRESFDAALDIALHAVSRGEDVELVLDRHATHAGGLRPLLESVADGSVAMHSRRPLRPSLAARYGAVREALEREREGSTEASTESVAAEPPWWQRRIAAVSFPAFALIVAGLVGATSVAGAIGLTGRLPSIVDLVRTEAGDPAQHAPPPEFRGTEPEREVRLVAPVDTPTESTVSGVITALTRGGFTLLADDRTWDVRIVGDTTIVGLPSPGALAIVTGVERDLGVIEASSVGVGAPQADPTSAPAVVEPTPPPPTVGLPTVPPSPPPPSPPPPPPEPTEPVTAPTAPPAPTAEPTPEPTSPDDFCPPGHQRRGIC